MICQARTSYLSSEVLWGHRFVPVLSYDVSHFRVDHAEFHKTYEVCKCVFKICKICYIKNIV